MNAKHLALNYYSRRFNDIYQLANETFKAYHYTFIRNGPQVRIFIANKEWVVPSFLHQDDSKKKPLYSNQNSLCEGHMMVLERYYLITHIYCAYILFCKVSFSEYLNFTLQL